MPKLTAVLVVLALSLCQAIDSPKATQRGRPEAGNKMELGAFSISLTVKDLAASRAFYEKLGFAVIAGSEAQRYLMLRNGQSMIGLFQGMFDKNIITFNPGWAVSQDHPKEFMDVRQIQRRLKKAGLELTTEADESTTGPASLTLVDPDGNPIYIDQHR